MPETPLLETPRFLMRPLERADAAALFPSFSDQEQMRYWSCPPFAAVDVLADWLTDPEWDGRSWVAVSRGAPDAPAIARFVSQPVSEGVCEIGYLVALGHQRHGIARECLVALIDQLFRAEGHRRIQSDVDPDNSPSNRLLEGLGFTCEGRLRATWNTHIGVRDSLIWGLLSQEWSGAA